MSLSRESSWILGRIPFSSAEGCEKARGLSLKRSFVSSAGSLLRE